jgi:hypothetical protein
MAHYRKIDVGIWYDEKFRSLKAVSKLIFFHLLTHPQMTSLGTLHHSIEGLAREMNVDAKGYAEAFGEVLAKGLIHYDKNALCVWVPNFVKYQCAESPNVIKAWVKQAQYIPECELKAKAVLALEGYVKGLSEAFREAFAKDGARLAAGYRESLSIKHGALSTDQNLPSQPEAVIKTIGTSSDAAQNVGNGGDDEF